MLLSVCILAKNSAHCLQKAIDSACMLGDEVIIRVDDSSTDKTRRIAMCAQPFWSGIPVSVHDYTFEGFGSARNGMIDVTKSAWIFMLDADEVIDTPDVNTIRERLLSDIRRACYSFPRHNWLDLKREKFHEEHYPDRQIRLFPGGGKINYGDQKVHEVVMGAPKKYFPDTEVHINHFCFAYRTHEDWHKVNQFYRKLGS